MMSIWQINKVFRDLDLHPSQRKYVNCIRLHPTESLQHFKAKCEICRDMMLHDIPFLTEVWTADQKRRFDVVDLENGEVIEIECKKNVYKTDADKTIYVGRDV